MAAQCPHACDISDESEAALFERITVNDDNLVFDALVHQLLVTFYCSTKQAEDFLELMDPITGAFTSPIMRKFALYALSGLMISASVAAKAAVLAPSASNESKTKNKPKATWKEKYHELLETHEALVANSSTTQLEAATLRQQYENAVAQHTIELSDAEDSVTSHMARIAKLEGQIKEAEDLITVATQKTTVLEDQLATNAKDYARSIEKQEKEKRVVFDRLDATTAELQRTMEELKQNKDLSAVLEEEKAESSKALTILRETVRIIKTEKADLTDTLSSTKEELAKTTASSTDNEARLLASQTRVSELEEVRQRYEELSKQSEEDSKALTVLKNQLTAAEERAKAMNEHHEGKLAERSATIDSQNAQIQELSGQNRSLGSKHDEIVLQLDKLRNEYEAAKSASSEALTNAEDELRALRQTHTAELAQLKQQTRELENDRSTALKKMEDQESMHKMQIETTRAFHEEKIAAAKEEVGQQQGDILAQLKAQHDETNSQLEQAQSTISEKEAALSALRQQHESLQQSSLHTKSELSSKIEELMLKQTKADEHTNNLHASELDSIRKKHQEELTETSQAHEAAKAQSVMEQQGLIKIHAGELSELEHKYAEQLKSLHLAQSSEIDKKDEDLENTKTLHQSELADLEESHAAELQYMKKAIDDFRNKLDESASNLKAAHASSEESKIETTKLSKQLEEVKTSHTELEMEKLSLIENVQSAQTQHEKLREQLTISQSSMREIETRHQTAQSTVQSTQKELESVLASLSREKQQSAQLQHSSTNAMSDLTLRFEKQAEELAGNRKQLETLTKKENQATAELTNLRQTVENERTRASQLELELSNHKTQLQQSTTSLTSLAEQKHTLEAQHSNLLQANVDESQSRRSSLSKYNRFEQEREELSRELDTVKADLAKLKDIAAKDSQQISQLKDGKVNLENRLQDAATANENKLREQQAIIAQLTSDKAELQTRRSSISRSTAPSLYNTPDRVRLPSIQPEASDLDDVFAAMERSSKRTSFVEQRVEAPTSPSIRNRSSTESPRSAPTEDGSPSGSRTGKLLNGLLRRSSTRKNSLAKSTLGPPAEI